MKKLTTFLILLANLITCQAQETASVKTDVCDCPEPTMQQFVGLCSSIYEKKSPTDESGLGFKYQENLYEMSCVDMKKDSKEVAYEKIRKMWNKYKEKFSCSHYSGVSLPDANVLKFSMDVGFPSFLITAIKKYELDMNFKDPIDGKTIMDFLQGQKESYLSGNYQEKVDEYLRIYELLKANGVKHASELNK